MGKIIGRGQKGPYKMGGNDKENSSSGPSNEKEIQLHHRNIEAPGKKAVGENEGNEGGNFVGEERKKQGGAEGGKAKKKLFDRNPNDRNTKGKGPEGSESKGGLKKQLRRKRGHSESTPSGDRGEVQKRHKLGSRNKGRVSPASENAVKG